MVDPCHRGRGLGKQLVCELHSFAERKGIKVLFLLTTTAADFFKKLGYEVTQRSVVPAPIADTEEYKNICLYRQFVCSRILNPLKVLREDRQGCRSSLSPVQKD